MSGPLNEEPFDKQIEAVVSVAAALGFNPVRVRWKLRAIVERMIIKSHQAGQSVRHVGYANKVCPGCGTVHAKDARVCTQCGARLDSRPIQLLRRIGIVTPRMVSMSTLLGALILLVYWVVFRDDPEGSFISFSIDALCRHGGLVPAYVLDGEWWRLGAAVFLHAGLMHLGFNIFALAQVGPQIEELFGRTRMVIFFMMTGVFANLVSIFWIHGVGIGASGAIMGLVGVAAGWGQRDGTSIGMQVRNGMLKWGLYTMIFGFFIGANNVAHAAGFLSGAALGYLVMPGHRRDAGVGPVSIALFIISVLMIAVSIAFVLFPALAGIVPYD
jgi:rhomboid protease GluP